MNEALPVIDLNLGAELLKSDEQTARRMVIELAVILTQNLQDLETAYAALDLAKVENIAHYIYGGSCYCGVPRLKAAAKLLEKAIQNSQTSPEIVSSAYRSLCQEIQAVIAAAEKLG